MEHKNDKTKETTPSSTESKGVLGTVWSAAGALAETVQHAVQGTIDAAYHTADRIQHEVEPVTNMVTESISDIKEKTADMLGLEKEKEVDATDAFFSSPTNDMMEATKSAPSESVSASAEIDTPPAPSLYLATSELIDNAKKQVTDIVHKAIDSSKDLVDDVSKTLQETTLNEQPKLELTMDIVAHLQRIADRTGDAILHDTARKAHSACAKGLSEAPGVNLVRVTPEQATELVNLAILTQDHELADFARYCQSVAATSQIGIEPSPGKIQEELAKGRMELSTQGRMHTGPGYGAAFASVSRSTSSSNLLSSAPVSRSTSSTNLLASTSASGSASGSASVSRSVSRSTSSSNLLSSAPVSRSTSSSNLFQSIQSDLQQLQLQEGGLQLTMDMVAHLQRIADRTGDQVLHDTARKAHSACAKNLSDSPGVHLVSITPDQASELVNLAIRTQDHELANFARYCQSVAATTQVGIEPSPGKIMQEIEKGRQELLQQGRTHNGPGYGAAFASISRSNSSTNLSLSRSNSSTSLSLSAKNSRSSSPTNVPIAPLSETVAAESMQLTMEVVAHLQRIADRTGDSLLHDTARKAHSACAKNLSDAPGVHLTVITPDQATELVNLAIRTQDTELADFARYCQSVAATTQVGIEPSPGKIMQEIEKGRQELLQQGRTHTGPGYGAAFASKPLQQVKVEKIDKLETKSSQDEIISATPSTMVGLPSQ